MQFTQVNAVKAVGAERYRNGDSAPKVEFVPGGPWSVIRTREPSVPKIVLAPAVVKDECGDKPTSPQPAKAAA